MKKIIILSAILVLATVGLMNKDNIVGFTTNRGFTTLQETNFLSNTGGTLTGTLAGVDATFSGTLGITGLTTLGYASASGNFEVGTNKFRVFGASGNLSTAGTVVFGSYLASGSGFDFQVVSDNTSTSSIDFDSGSAVGTCMSMRNTEGTLTYCRIVGTTFTCNTTSCK